MEDECCCIKCRDQRQKPRILAELLEDFRYGCEICGNKRCPHHSDHELACTNSNEAGQPGSVYAEDRLRQ